MEKPNGNKAQTAVMSTNVSRASLKTKKFKANETEKAELPLGNEHFEVEVKRRNSKFLEVPFIYSYGWQFRASG